MIVFTSNKNLWWSKVWAKRWCRDILASAPSSTSRVEDVNCEWKKFSKLLLVYEKISLRGTLAQSLHIILTERKDAFLQKRNILMIQNLLVNIPDIHSFIGNICFHFFIEKKKKNLNSPWLILHPGYKSSLNELIPNDIDHVWPPSKSRDHAMYRDVMGPNPVRFEPAFARFENHAKWKYH